MVKTKISYDFAIKGDGFFTVEDPQDQSIYYTRAGNFHRSDDNYHYLVDVHGMDVLGIQPTITGDKITNEFTNTIGSSIIEDDTTIISLNTFATDYKKTVVDTGVSGSNYKDAGTNFSDIEGLITSYKHAISAYEKDIKVGDPASKQVDTVTFPTTKEPADDYSIEITIDGVKFQSQYDISVEQTLKNLSDSINKYSGVTSSVDTTTGELTISSMIPGQKIITSKAVYNQNIIPVETRTLASGSGQNLIDAIYVDLKTLLEANGAKIASIKTEIVKTPSGEVPVQGKLPLNLDVLGISENQVGDLQNDNGDLYLIQGDAKYLVGKLAPVVFQENTSLRPEGQNLYSSTQKSGEPLFVAEKAIIEQGYLELSSSDLTESLVNLMVWQKAFDANSKTITTSDEMLKTALAMKNK
jgi:flagellar hook protein FlgE